MIKLDVIGFPKLEQKLRTMPSSVRKEVNMEFRAWADDVARDAKANLQSKTSNTGKLAGSINPEYGDNYSAVTVSANYAAYVEFGTRKFASQYVGSLPNNWKQMANAAKGPGGGNFDQFLQSITQWMKDRGIDEKLRFPIMRKILRDGVRPQPYLYPAVIKNTIALRKRLKKILR
jgi:hypothetical protein